MEKSICLGFSMLVMMLFAQDDDGQIVLTPFQLIGFSVGLSAFCAAAAASRDKDNGIREYAVHVTNLSGLSACLTTIGYTYARNSEFGIVFLIGTSGLIALGGMESLNFVLDKFRALLQIKTKGLIDEEE